MVKDKANNSKQSTRQRLLRWVILLVILVVIGILAYFKGRDFWNTLQQQWAQANLNFVDFGYSWFIVGLVVFLLSVLSTFLRWHILLHALHIKCSRWDAIRLGFVGYVVGMFMPGSTMGDVFKAGFIMKENPGNRVGALASIVVDRFVGLYSLFLLSALIGLIYLNTILSFQGERAHELQIAFMVICGVAVGGIVFYALFALLPFNGERLLVWLHRIRWVGPILSKIFGAFLQFRRYPLAMVQSVALGMLGHVGFVLSYYFASMALPGPGETPDWQMHFVVIPFFMVFQAVPLTPGGNLGVGDLILGQLYTIVGGLQLKGILASLIQRLITWIVALIGLIWYLPLQRRFQQQAAAATPIEPAPAPSVLPASSP
ncbi:MAG TPA: lysylphosphatidylglycerol synthase transmembrane domain-containing protein [Gemmatales bacterium]|nr:lysylphosphatidylglycerol synthase transmembrane domain-containing protein [Gemmatales bacterium]